MAQNKTRPNAGDVMTLLESITDPIKKKDSLLLLRMMEEITGEPPVMWGDSIVGFGTYHYTYASGREGEWFLVGFSPRKQNLTIYLKGYLDQYQDLLQKLGKHKHGKGCLYIGKLEEIDDNVLRSLVSQSAKKGP